MDNQRVVILGGTSGIGAAVAQAAADRGADVVVVSSSKAKVDAAVDRLPRATGAAVDLTDPGATAAFFATVGEFDHLVYTAGEPLSLMPVAAYDAERARAFSSCGTSGCSARCGTPYRKSGPAARSP